MANNAAVYAPSGTTLTISGSGRLIASGGPGGAGIGGGYGSGTSTASGSITITDQAQVTAIGVSLCAGIGNCQGTGSKAGNITVDGEASVSATGGVGGAGIGGGSKSGGGTTNITGQVTVTAEGGIHGAGIGGGWTGAGGEIYIQCASSDSAACPSVTARAGALAAGIGAAYNLSLTAGTTDIKISGGTISATSPGPGGTGIGVGAKTSLWGTNWVDIKISGGHVIAVGGDSSGSTAAGAGIGGSLTNSDTSSYSGIYLYGGTVVAIGGADTAGGYGYNCGPGIGNAGNGKAAYAIRSIYPQAIVKAYSQCYSQPPIKEYNYNSGDSPIFSAFIDPNSFDPTVPLELDVHKWRVEPVWDTLKLPVGYTSFAFSTGSQSLADYSITAYDATDRALLGQVCQGSSEMLTSAWATDVIAVRLRAPAPTTVAL